jgi:hypothetical protein
VGREKILLKQIDINDLFQEAIKGAKAGGKIDDIINGLDRIDRKFTKVLKDEGVEEIILEKFDPNLCEAMIYTGSDKEEGTILEVYRKGFQMNGKLMRPAVVKVANGEPEPPEPEDKPHVDGIDKGKILKAIRIAVPVIVIIFVILVLMRLLK